MHLNRNLRFNMYLVDPPHAALYNIKIAIGALDPTLGINLPYPPL